MCNRNQKQGWGHHGRGDGKNKYTSDVRFMIRITLKDAGIETSYPHRVVDIKGGLPQ